MEFVCSKKDIQGSISLVERIVATRSTLPIIANILFEANKTGIKLSANNLEIGIEIAVKAKVAKTGSILMPAKTLVGIVSKLPDTDISFKLNEKNIMRISYEQSSFNIHTLPPDEFPILPKIKETKSVDIDSGILREMIKQTIFAASSSEDKYVLTGILIETGKGAMAGDDSDIRLIATDGYRLAKRGENIGIGAEKGVKVIVPAKALAELSRILQNDESEKIKIIFSNEQIAFKCENVYLVSRIIQGKFPDYQQVIPKKSKTSLVVETKSFLEAVERAAVIAAGSANIVRLEVKSGKLHIVANTPDVGNIDEIIEAKTSGVDKAQVAFNVRLLADVLKVVEAESVRLEISEALSPGVIKEENGKDYVYIVMPIRTQEVAA